MNPKLKFCFLFILFCCFSFSLRAQTITIQGKFLGADEKPSADALTGISTDPSGNITDFVKCDAKGSYSISINKPGLVNLVFCMPNHEPLYMPIYNNRDRSFTIDVQLSYYKYVSDFNNVNVMGDFAGLYIKTRSQ